jgi:hypothetical protein
VPNGPVLVGLIVAVNPFEAETVRNTVLLNPFTPPREIVDVPNVPAAMVRLAGLAVMVKSGVGSAFTITDTLVECDNAPLTAKTITV